ncbi:MAG: hypothetical protein R6W75_04970, partial [Smithellaceae bacterium]
MKRSIHVSCILSALVLGCASVVFADTASPVLPTEMPDGMTLLVAYVLMALVFSFLCSVAEAVLLSITPS